jgi:competence protein ComEC
MPDERASDAANVSGAWWRAALVLAWIAGIAIQLRQPALWWGDAYRLIAAGGLGLALAALVAARSVRSGAGAATGREPWRVLRPGCSRVAGLAAAAALGFACAGWRATRASRTPLAPEWEGRDLELVGVVEQLPQVGEDGERFVLAVEAAHAPPSTQEGDRRSAPTPPRVPSLVWLTWTRGQRDDPAVGAPPAPLRAGQRWRLPVRLGSPHGASNPGGFDAELWLFEQGLRATGTVRGRGELLGETFAPIERLRQWVRDRLLLFPAPPAATGALAALAVGDQAAIDGASWEVFRDTGVAHLMSISGLHITMLGWLAGAAIGAAWRRCEPAMLRVPAPVAARWGGRRPRMGVCAGRGLGHTGAAHGADARVRGAAARRRARLARAARHAAAMVPVTALDPWALLQPGFWLSFAAVGLLMMSEPVRAPRPIGIGEQSSECDGDRPPPAVGEGAGNALPAARLRGRLAALARRLAPALGARVRAGVRAQVIASVGLAPLTLVAFEQVSLVGLVANLVAAPWITLVVTPLALLGIALPPLWSLAALALEPLLSLLAALGRWPFASVHVASAPAWGLASGLAGGAVLMLPLPWRARLLGLPLLLPLVAPYVARPAAGALRARRRRRGAGRRRARPHARAPAALRYRPRFGDSADAGRRVLLPLLRSRGEPRIDALVLSHADADHVGGAQSLIDRLPVLALRSSLTADNALRRNPLAHARCEAGQSWTWDGVRFSMLHPLAADYRPGAKTNAVSCVLRIADAAGRSVLLTGDIEAAQEAALVVRDAPALRSDVLVVPHHGSGRRRAMRSSPRCIRASP